MADQNMETTVAATPAEAAAPEVLQVSEAAVEVAVGVDDEKLENRGGGDDHGGVAVSVASGGEGELGSKRKRGRPRKLPPGEVRQQFMFMPAPEYSPTLQKRGRGRPRGSGKWQAMASPLGGSDVESSVGSNFTPYTMTIQPGENIVQRIWSFSQVIPDSICILSASGTISSAEVFLPSSRGGILRYEGQFSIVYLNGSHTYDERRGAKNCLLSVQLANAEGRFYGGAVAGSLIAAGPTHIIIATFRQQRLMRQQLNITRPRYSFEPPKFCNKATVPVPLQAEESVKLADHEAKSTVATAHPVHDRPVDEMVIDGPNTRDASRCVTSDVEIRAVD